MGWFGYAWHPFGVEAFVLGWRVRPVGPERHVRGRDDAAREPARRRGAAGRAVRLPPLRWDRRHSRARLGADESPAVPASRPAFGVSFKDMLLRPADPVEHSGEQHERRPSMLKSGRTYVGSVPAISADLAVALRVDKNDRGRPRRHGRSSRPRGSDRHFEPVQPNQPQYLAGGGAHGDPVPVCRLPRITSPAARRRSSGRTSGPRIRPPETQPLERTLRG